MSNKPHNKAEKKITKISAQPQEKTESRAETAKTNTDQTKTDLTKQNEDVTKTEKPAEKPTEEKPELDEKEENVEQKANSESEKVKNDTKEVKIETKEAGKNEKKSESQPTESANQDIKAVALEVARTEFADEEDEKGEIEENDATDSAESQDNDDKPVREVKTVTLGTELPPAEKRQALSSNGQKPPKARKKSKKNDVESEEKPLREVFILVRPFVAIGRYLRDSWRELRQVRWPNRKTAWQMTLAVLIYCVIFVALIMALDAFFTFIFNLLLG